MPIHTYICATAAWLQSVVIAYGICPFAKREVDNASVAYSVCLDTDIEPCLIHLLEECGRLDEDDSIATLLVIYPKAFVDFDSYLDFLQLAEDLLADQGYEGIYQLASFHPDYCFQGAKFDDAANYTNRSPYPMLHLLREEGLEKALANYPNPEQIPERNIALTRKLGVAKMQALLDACYQNDEGIIGK